MPEIKINDSLLIHANSLCEADLLYFDSDGNGTQDHVAILNGRYSPENASEYDISSNPKYSDEPAFFGQNDNHCSFSVRENLESHPCLYFYLHS